MAEALKHSKKEFYLASSRKSYQELSVRKSTSVSVVGRMWWKEPLP